MVAECLHVSDIPLNLTLEVSLVACQRKVSIAHTMRLHIGLRHYIQPISVAKIIPYRVVGIMACADRIDIILLHYAYVLYHSVDIHVIACLRIHLMAVDTLDQDRFAVDIEIRSLDLDPAYSDVCETDSRSRPPASERVNVSL